MPISIILIKIFKGKYKDNNMFNERDLIIFLESPRSLRKSTKESTIHNKMQRNPFKQPEK